MQRAAMESKRALTRVQRCLMADKRKRLLDTIPGMDIETRTEATVVLAVEKERTDDNCVSLMFTPESMAAACPDPPPDDEDDWVVWRDWLRAHIHWSIVAAGTLDVESPHDCRVFAKALSELTETRMRRAVPDEVREVIEEEGERDVETSMEEARGAFSNYYTFCRVPGHVRTRVEFDAWQRQTGCYGEVLAAEEERGWEAMDTTEHVSWQNEAEELRISSIISDLDMDEAMHLPLQHLVCYLRGMAHQDYVTDKHPMRPTTGWVGVCYELAHRYPPDPITTLLLDAILDVTSWTRH